MAGTKTIVFGATGAVGGATARAAQQNGAEVILAMRDVRKPVSPSLDGFEKVQADLSKPDTVREAVMKTGAKHAFIYCIFELNDGMRASLEAMKSAGIEFVVFLSSVSIHGDPRNADPNDLIQVKHSQVEIQLEEIFGKTGYVALRPAWFSTNIEPWLTKTDEVELLYPDAEFDWIVPTDIGDVAGKIAAEGRKGAQGQNVIRLIGPEMVSQREFFARVHKVLGKDIEIKAVSEDKALQILVNKGYPKPIGQYLVATWRSREQNSDELYGNESCEEAQSNISKFSGKKATKVEEWIAANPQLF